MNNLQDESGWLSNRKYQVGVLLLGLLSPYLARIPGIPKHGIRWLVEYFPSLGGFIFFGLLDLLPFGFLLFLRKSKSDRIIPFWFGVVFAFVFVFVLHGLIDLASDAQAAVVLVFIPLYAIPVSLVGWIIGFLFQWFQRKRNG
jgi:hypothetical protein